MLKSMPNSFTAGIKRPEAPPVKVPLLKEHVDNCHGKGEHHEVMPRVRSAGRPTTNTSGAVGRLPGATAGPTAHSALRSGSRT